MKKANIELDQHIHAFIPEDKRPEVGENTPVWVRAIYPKGWAEEVQLKKRTFGTYICPASSCPDSGLAYALKCIEALDYTWDWDFEKGNFNYRNIFTDEWLCKFSPLHALADLTQFKGDVG